VPDPAAEYSKRLEARLKIAAEKERAHLRIGYWKLAVIVAGLAALWLAAEHYFSPYWLFLPAGIYAILAIFHELIIRARTRAESAAAFYRRGIARMEDRWAGTGEPGERFRDAKHIYADDLDIFGRGSLFELLSTARLPMGEDRLAAWLTAPSPKEKVIERQSMISGLRDKLDLREDLAVTGEALRARLNPESLISWSKGAPILPAGVWRTVALALAICGAGAIICGLASSRYLPVYVVLLMNAIMWRMLNAKADATLDGLSCNAEGLILFSKILKRLEDEPFDSPGLQELSAQLKQEGPRASDAISKVARIVSWSDGRHSLIAHLAELPFLYTIQVAYAAESWRLRWGGRMRAWVDVTGEMEALLSLAAYSSEHPSDPFPEFMESQNSGAIFDGQELGHPLIPAAKCVRNSVRLDAQTRVLLISGSNMSGKSTLLRTVGINTVLAMAGAPVRAKSLQLTPLAIGTRIRSEDSLQEGRSNFYTEILQIRKVFELAKGNAPLLFLFDELLEGTNSNDRRIGAEGLLRALLGLGAIGIVTTHDLALTEITKSLGDTIRNKHFQDHVEDGKMVFDYKLQEGVVARSNAIALMRLIGLDV
jgi:hypothetical protein